jgi:putative membrane protein
MITFRNTKTSSAVCRSLLASGVLFSALALRADQADIDKTKEGASTAATTRRAGPADTATCIKEAAKMNQGTIRFAQLAAQKAQSPELKRFSQTLEQDHKKAQAELETIAKKHYVTLPTTLDAKCEQELSRLQGLSGEEFDKEFAKGAVEGHAMALAHLQQSSTEVKDPDLSQYTRNMLTQLRDHQRRSREIARAVGVDQATITSIENKAKEGVGTGATSETSTETSPTKDSKQPKE